MAELGVGSTVPSFELPDQQDYPWSLSGQLEAGPVVLVFYRGDWCPYCNGQLASYARKYDEFERRGAQVAGISVDPPHDNAKMVGKLRAPFPLLSDATGEVSRAYGLWDERENVATPAVVVVGRSGEVSYLYAGSDFADRPRDEELFAALDALGERGVPGSRIERRTGGPELRTTAAEARNGSVRPDRPALSLDELHSYYRGAFSTTEALGGRLTGRLLRRASREVTRHQDLVRVYARATQETADLAREQS
ncbi:redoxin domain-containing protein [Rubrobacter tropicus]|uniref:thioredoxin-dependent peroxiredoxin n=1 Tax=Rubrobacter tropicus TaxID=2653851 RepID=A0A6G8QED1_9ACTN|nr:peroxiredoxin family protein [Rubrobacter tropicus]QIN84856.1 redoxin domain-containing protein [Rubrobacter tropicus]